MDLVFNKNNMKFNFRVAGILLENGHVLLHKAIEDNHWALPGGRVQIGEDTVKSIQREFLEELGMNINVGGLLWSVESFFSYNSQDFHEIGFYYKVSSVNSVYQNEIFHGPEGDRLIYKWVHQNELFKINLYPEFLKEGLMNLPEYPSHLIIN